MSVSNTTSNTDDQDDLQEDRFIFYECTIPSLQKMAAYRVATSILYHYLSFLKQKQSEDCYFTILEKYYTDKNYCDRFEKLVSTLEIPRPIKEILMEYSCEVFENVAQWICNGVTGFNAYNIDNYIGMKDLLNPNSCVWYPYGKINYRKTAKNILLTYRLNDVQKFVFMSVYCMEDELKTFSFDSLTPEFMKLIHFDGTPVLYYWICYLRKTMHEIPLNGFSSIDVSMAANILKDFKHFNGVYWTAFEYFWNRLGNDDQVMVAKLALNAEPHTTYAYRKTRHPKDVFHLWYVEERLLSMLSWHQQRSLFHPTLDRSMLNFCIFLDSPETVFWAWKHSKNRITVEQFAEMVPLIFKENREFENKMELFACIWKTVPDHFRKYVFENMENNMIEYFFNLQIFPSTCVNFLREFLSLKSANFRDETMFNNAIDILAKIDDPRSITDFLEFCIPDEIRQKELKKLIFNSDQFKNKCVDTFMFKDLNLLNIQLEYYASDVNDVRKLKNWLVECDTLKKNLFQFMFDNVSWRKLNTVVDDVYPSKPSLALKRKKQIISSFAARNFFREFPYYYTTHDGDWENFTEILNQLQYTIEEMRILKRSFLNGVKKNLYSCGSWGSVGRNCSKNNFKIFISWCLDNDAESILNFKSSISLDVIVDKVFNSLPEIYYDYDGYYFDSVLSDLDEIVRWCCLNLEEVKKYKLSRINTFHDMKVFKWLKKIYFMDRILEWLFEGDEEAIRKYKSEKLRFRRIRNFLRIIFLLFLNR